MLLLVIIVYAFLLQVHPIGSSGSTGDGRMLLMAPYHPVLLCMQAVNTQVPHHIGLWLCAFVFDGVV